MNIHYIFNTIIIIIFFFFGKPWVNIKIKDLQVYYNIY